MIDIRDLPRHLDAWCFTTNVLGFPPPVAGPDLRLEFVIADEEILMVEVTRGYLRSGDVMLFVPGCGTFEVAAVLHRRVGQRCRVFLRLHRAEPPRLRKA